MTKPICILECEDCGKFAVLQSNYIYGFIIDSDINVISRCAYCDRVIFDIIDSIDIAEFLFNKGVEFLNWNTGEDVENVEGFKWIENQQKSVGSRCPELG